MFSNIQHAVLGVTEDVISSQGGRLLRGVPVYNDMASSTAIRSSESMNVATCSGVVLLVNEASPMNGISISFSLEVDLQRQGCLPHVIYLG